MSQYWIWPERLQIVRLPETRRTIETGGQDYAPIWTELGASDAVSMGEIRVQPLASRRFPHTRCVIFASRDDLIIIWAEGCVVDPT